MDGLSRELDWMTQTRNVNATQVLGRILGEAALPGTLVLLSGDLGAGKTAFTQGVARGLQIAEPVNSPTFTILKEHRSGRLPLFHFDLYRVATEDELWSLGFDEYFVGQGICVIEWAERVTEVWDNYDEWLWVTIQSVSSMTRCLEWQSKGNRHRDLLETIRSGNR
jgi:tRNA threonylcarbamoyladenosine biosynthesis protein TsaE